MTKIRKTKNALIASILSLLLCVSMFAGTTMAWFTDSVASANNIIKSGNLDIELEYAVFNADGTFKEWKDVKNASDILTNELWEPGVAEVAYLRVANAGSLALKYQLGINIIDEKPGKNVAGDELKLSDYLVFKAININSSDVGTYTRETAINAAGTELGLATYNSGTKTLLKGAEEYVALIVYMPTSITNEANHNGSDIPQIDLGINVVATQLDNVEEDAFGKDYDEDAEYPIVVNNTKEDNEEITLKAGNEVSLDVPAGAPSGNYTLDVSNKTVETDAKGNTTVGFDISLLKNGEKVQPDGTTKYAVSINVGAGKNVVGVNHNGSPVATFNYDSSTGVVSFETDSFSPFEVLIHGGKVESSADFEHLTENEKIKFINLTSDLTLTSDVTLGEGQQIIIPEDATVTLDLNGKTIYGTGLNAKGSKVHVVINNGDAIIKNGKIEVTGSNGGSGIYNAKGANLVIENMTVIGAPRSGESWPSYAINNYGTMTVDGLTVNSNHGAISLYGDADISNANVTMNGMGGSSHVFYIGGEGTEVVINSGKYTHAGNVDGSLAYIMTGTTVTVNGGTFSASNGGYGMATYTGSLIVNGGTFANAFLDWGGPITISGGTFATKPADKYIAEGYKAVQNADGTWTVIPPVTVSSATELRSALDNEDGNGNIIVTGEMKANDTVDVPSWTDAPAEYVIDATWVSSVTGGNYILEQASRYGIVARVSSGESLKLSNMNITANSQWPIYLSNYGGTLTLEDIDVTATQGAGIYPYGTNGTTTIKSATVNQKALSDEFASSTPWAGTAIATSNGHNLIIEDGTYIGSTWGVYVYNSGANVTINGGTFIAPKVIQADGVWSTGGNKSVVTVNDGNFDGALYLDWGTTPPEIYINGGNFTNFSATVNGAAKLVIKGGTFDADPSAYVADGYTATESNGTWTVSAN